MSRYINWLVLNDGVFERVTEDVIDPIESAGVIDRTLIPIVGGSTGWAMSRRDGYRVTGDIGSKRATLRLLDEGAVVADIAICLHSRSSEGLWSELLSKCDHSMLPDLIIPESPWCAVLCYAPEIAYPDWFDHWTKNVAFSLLGRKGW